MLKRFKPTFIIMLICLFAVSFFIISPTFATESKDVTETVFFGNVKDDGSACGVYTILNLVVDIMSIGIGMLGVIGITVVGIKYLTAGGNEEQTRKAKQRMFQIVIGLVAGVLLYSGLQFLLPNGKLNFNNTCSTVSNEELQAIKDKEKKELEEAAAKSRSSQSNSRSKTKSKSKQEDTGVDENGSTANGRKILQAAEWTAKHFDKKGYKYYYVKYEEEHFGWGVAEKDKKSHCSSYVTLVVKKAGLLPENDEYVKNTPKKISDKKSKNNYRIWCGDNKNLKYRENSSVMIPYSKTHYIKNNFKVKHHGKYESIKSLVKSKELVPGDIFCPKEHHIAIYGGKVKKGKNKGKYIVWQVYGGNGARLTYESVRTLKPGSHKVGDILHAR